jgi:hypothetical protein
MYIDNHVNFILFLPDLKEILMFSIDFEKIQYQISRKSVQKKPSFSMRMERRKADRYNDVKNHFLQFSKRV